MAKLFEPGYGVAELVCRREIREELPVQVVDRQLYGVGYLFVRLLHIDREIVFLLQPLVVLGIVVVPVSREVCFPMDLKPPVCAKLPLFSLHKETIVCFVAAPNFYIVPVIGGSFATALSESAQGYGLSRLRRRHRRYRLFPLHHLPPQGLRHQLLHLGLGSLCSLARSRPLYFSVSDPSPGL